MPTHPRTTNLDSHIGAYLRRRRCQLGLTQQELADLIGVTYQQAHKYEKGMNRISAARLLLMAQVLQFDLAEFAAEMAKASGPVEPPYRVTMAGRQVRELVAAMTPEQQGGLVALMGGVG